MSEYTEEEQRILAYLTDSVTRGERYVRSKTIADAIGLTAKQVGSRLPVSPKKSDDVDIEKWGRARSTTWRVTRKADAPASLSASASAARFWSRSFFRPARSTRVFNPRGPKRERMTVRVSRTFEFDAPAEDVWAFISDAEQRAEAISVVDTLKYTATGGRRGTSRPDPDDQVDHFRPKRRRSSASHRPE